jgi:uncharacterized protein (TIGR02266 family)
VEERRKSWRWPIVTDVGYEYLGISSRGRITDLSQGGFFIDTMNTLPEGADIRFRIDLPGDESRTPLSGEALVIWQRPMAGMGVRFIKLSPEDRERLTAFLSSQ